MVFPMIACACFILSCFFQPDPITDEIRVVEEVWLRPAGGGQEVVVQELEWNVNGVLYGALVLKEIRNTARNEAISLIQSPLWRLDLRRAVDLRETPPPESAGHADWGLIPPRKPGRDQLGATERWLSNGPLWFSKSGATSLSVQRVSSSEAKMLWKGIQAEEFLHASGEPLPAASLDVLLRITFDEELQPVATLQVDLDNPASDGLALFSAEFPALVLPSLAFGEEPLNNEWVDDVLVTPYDAGGLIPDPIYALRFADIEEVDNVNLGAKPDTKPYQSSKLTYPGRIPVQFWYYYDLEDISDGDWALYGSAGKLQVRRKPAHLREGGTGLFMATLDRGRNLKRLLQYSLVLKYESVPVNHLALAIRNFFAFREEDHARLTQGGQDWTHFIGAAGLDGGFALQRKLDYDATFRVLHGNWYDAAATYRAWLEKPISPRIHEGRHTILLRDNNGLPILLRERARANGLDRIPEPYLGLGGIIGIGETGPNLFDPKNEHPIGEWLRRTQQEDFTTNVKEFFTWLRADSHLYGGDTWLATGHTEGMKGPHGFGVKVSGNDFFNEEPRPGLVEFNRELRKADATSGWPGRILVATNRDTGGGPDQEKLPESQLQDNFFSYTEQLEKIRRSAKDENLERLYSTAFNRASMRRYFKGLLEEHLRYFKDPDSDEIQVDLLTLSGVSTEARPEYSLWAGPDETLETAGGGSSWADGVRETFRDIVGSLDPGYEVSPNLFAGCERINEATMAHMMPLGPNRSLPLEATVDDVTITGPGRHRSLWEPVPLLTVIFHEHTLLRGGLQSHALYAMGRTQNRRERLVAGNDPPTQAELERSQRLVSHHLATEVVVNGRIPNIFVSGDRAALDWTFSDRIGLGPDDQAKASFEQGEPMWFVRELIRARQTAEHLRLGRSIRNVELLPNGSEGNAVDWLASEIHVLQHGQSGEPTLKSLAELSIPRLVHGTWQIRGGAETPVGGVEILVVVANPSQDSSEVSYETPYSIRFDPRCWILTPGRYELRAHDLDWSTHPDSELEFLHSDAEVMQSTIPLSGQALHLWSIRRISS